MKILYNLDLEKSILASLMSIEDCYLKINEIITIDDFAAAKHQEIFKAIEALYSAGEPVDLIMVVDYMRRTKTFHGIGGDSYIAEILATSPASLFNVIAYAERVKELSEQRRAISVLEDARLLINDDGILLEYKIANVVSELLNLSNSKNTLKEPRSISNLVDGFLRNQENLIKGIKPTQQKTGFFDLDRIAQIQNSNLAVMAARPAMGKTTLALNTLSEMVNSHRVLDEKGLVLSEKIGVIFSLEMSEDEMFVKFISSEAGLGIDNTRIREGKITEDEWAAIQNKIVELGEDYPLYIDDTSAITYQQIRAKLLKLKAKGKDIGIIVIDYLQIMGGLDANNLVNSLAEITGALKGLAKEFDCPIILLSQLNRDLEKRPNKRPINSDLRSSGSIEQDADIIMFIYRDEVYNENSDQKGVAEVIIGKNRHGAIGTVRLGFDGAKSKFSDFILQYDEDGNQFHD